MLDNKAKALQLADYTTGQGVSVKRYRSLDNSGTSLGLPIGSQKGYLAMSEFSLILPVATIGSRITKSSRLGMMTPADRGTTRETWLPLSTGTTLARSERHRSLGFRFGANGLYKTGPRNIFQTRGRNKLQELTKQEQAKARIARRRQRLQVEAAVKRYQSEPQPKCRKRVYVRLLTRAKGRVIGVRKEREYRRLTKGLWVRPDGGKVI